MLNINNIKDKEGLTMHIKGLEYVIERVAIASDFYQICLRCINGLVTRLTVPGAQGMPVEIILTIKREKFIDDTYAVFNPIQQGQYTAYLTKKQMETMFDFFSNPNVMHLCL